MSSLSRLNVSISLVISPLDGIDRKYVRGVRLEETIADRTDGSADCSVQNGAQQLTSACIFKGK